MQVCQVSASSSLRFLRRRILNIFSKIYPLCCHSNQSFYPTGIKNINFCSPYLCYVCNMERIGLTVSEEMSFENVD